MSCLKSFKICHTAGADLEYTLRLDNLTTSFTDADYDFTAKLDQGSISVNSVVTYVAATTTVPNNIKLFWHRDELSMVRPGTAYIHVYATHKTTTRRVCVASGVVTYSGAMCC